jgi:hypothetical protein
MLHPGSIAKIEQLIADLRSGEFRKAVNVMGIKYLDSPPKYCAVGVFLHRRAEEGVIEEVTLTPKGNIISFRLPGDDDVTESSHDDLYLKSLGNDYEAIYLIIRVMGWNDAGISFNDIAGLLEQELEYHASE